MTSIEDKEQYEHQNSEDTMTTQTQPTPLSKTKKITVTEVFSYILKQSLHISSLTELNGMIIYRDLLLNDDLYDKFYNMGILKSLETVFTSRALYVAHYSIAKQRKWPLLNLVRQILNRIGYKMVPFKKANGYDKSGKKLWIRYFEIKSTKNTTNSVNNNTQE